MDELSYPDMLENSLNTGGVQAGTSHADDVLAELSQKVMRVMRKATKLAEDSF